MEIVFKLIQRQGTLEQVGTFLRSKKLPSSAGSWADMIGLRLRPSLSDGSLSEDDVISLLRQTEEHGSQHIFFFDLVKGRDISRLFDARLPGLLKAAGLPALGTTSIVDMPNTPTVVEVRHDPRGDNALIFKIVEKRAHLEKISDSAQNGRVIVTYDEIPYRAVNVMRISDKGTAEIRVQSHTDPISYAGLCEAVFTLLRPVVDRLDWRDHKLDKFKSNLFDSSMRSKLMSIFGLRQSQHSNLEGNRLTAAAGMPGASMYDDDEVVASVDRFLKKQDHAHCERATVTIRKSDSLRRSIGLIVSGEANELAIASKVSRDEYNYIVSQVLEYNK
ncbi:hypothetical protein X743_29770 [Mesorhizobium sp. LNHC252B00]|nr:hypothetical protein X743_29770 [Mesorhizobium sp. LNHC252B00]